MRPLTEREVRICTMLSKAHELHALLPQLHPADLRRFFDHITAATEMILSRPIAEYYAKAGQAAESVDENSPDMPALTTGGR